MNDSGGITDADGCLDVGDSAGRKEDVMMTNRELTAAIATAQENVSRHLFGASLVAVSFTNDIGGVVMWTRPIPTGTGSPQLWEWGVHNCDADGNLSSGGYYRDERLAQQDAQDEYARRVAR